MFSPALVCLCVYVCVCPSVTTITKKTGRICTIMRRFLGVKGRSSSCFVTIGRWM